MVDIDKQGPDGNRVNLNLSETFGGALTADRVDDGEYLITRKSNNEELGTLRAGFVLGVADLIDKGDHGMAYSLLKDRIPEVSIDPVQRLFKVAL